MFFLESWALSVLDFFFTLEGEPALPDEDLFFLGGIVPVDSFGEKKIAMG